MSLIMGAYPIPEELDSRALQEKRPGLRGDGGRAHRAEDLGKRL
jgi:hypothetical protein